MRVDAMPENNNEPWLTARDIIAEQGFNAEFLVIRLIGELFSQGNHEDVVLFFDVLHAIELLQARKNITAPKGCGISRLVVVTWPLERKVSRLNTVRAGRA